MPKFDAATAVEKLDWDFSAFEGGSGVTPEPNEKLLANYLRDLANLTIDIAKGRKDLGLAAEPTAEDLIEAVAKLKTSDILEDLFEHMTVIVADLCQQSPSVEQIKKLPMRHKSAFFSYMSENVRPEVFGAATTTRLPTR